MRRYEQWRANPSSVQVQSQLPPASNSNPQPSAPRRSIHSHGTNTPSSSSTRSSSRSRRSIPPRSRTPSPYDQSPHEEDMVVLRDAPHRRDETYSAEGAQMYAREDDTRRRREWEEEGRRRMTEQRRQEQDGIVRRQREADHVAQAARLGHPTGQNPSVTVPVSASFSAPVPSIQYPSISAPATASASSGPIAEHLQMPLESPTRCVILRWNVTLLRMFSWYSKNSNTGHFQTNLIECETLFPSGD